MLVDTFGCRWTLDVRGLGDPLAGEVEHLWERARVADEDGGDAPRFVARRREDGSLEVDGGIQHIDDLDLPYAFSRALTLAAIRRRTGQCVMLHAAGLAGPDGATVALVAASGTGKTTAGLVLGRALGYVSDETVAVEEDLRVRAHPKPLSVVVDPARPGIKHERSPDDLGLHPAPADLRLVATVVLERDAAATDPVLEPIGLVEAARLVLPQTSALPSLERPLDRLARVLTAGHGPWRLRYAEIEDCVDLVADLAAGGTPGGTPEAVSWQWVAGDGPDEGPPQTDGVPGAESMVRRAGFDDALVSDDGVLVMQRRVPTGLPGLAGAVWRGLDRPRSVPELVVAATSELGPHPEAGELVLDTVRALHEGGLVARC